MRLFLTTFFMLWVVPQMVRASDSEFIAAVYEHPFSSLKNKTNIPTKQEALSIVMDNMNLYEQQIIRAKEKVSLVCSSLFRRQLKWKKN